jgi:copper homeostasis protein (lipoprotein)
MRMTIVAVCLLMLIGCNREDSPPAPTDALPTPATRVEPTTVADTAPASLDPLPALYSGVLPCADCTGIRYDIDLRPSNFYFLRMTYLGATPERSYDDVGAWSLASDLRTLALKGARQSPLLFAINNVSSLRKLDAEGQVIESELNYGLKRAATYQPLTPQVPLRGMYRPADAGAMIEECTTGLKLKLEGPTAENLAQEFVQQRKGEARPMLVAVEGKIDAPAGSDEALLIPTSDAKFWPGETCGARGVTHDLEGSRWVLVRIGDKPILPEEGSPEPYIVLQATSKQIAGHAGCNRLSGGYQIKGDTLQLTQLTTTRMACPELETEYAFLNSLEGVARWRLMDNQLVLLDKNNTAVLQFESRNL